MIDLKVECGNCQLKAVESSTKLSCEAAVAVHALTVIFAKSTNMSFEAAALTIMQANLRFHNEINDD